MNNEAKCDCQRCGNPIAFPVDLLNTEVECPHCHKATTLIVPPPESRIRAIQSPSVSSMHGQRIEPALRQPALVKPKSALAGVVLAILVLVVLGILAAIWRYSILAQREENMGNALFGK